MFTFGVGPDVDIKLVTETATAGRGDHAFIKDGGNLKAVVVKALGHASQPSLADCQFTHSVNGNPEFTEKEVFRNQLFRRTLLLDKSDFNKLVTKFKSSQDPVSGLPVEWSLEPS